jgi:hypothetical protein
MKIWTKVGPWLLIGFIGINILGAAYHFALQGKQRKVRQPAVVEMGSKFPQFSGIDVQGVSWKARTAPCRVIRVTDDHCAFCKKDQPAYETFVDVARKASCEIIELSAMAGKMAANPRPGIVQLKFIDTDVSPVLYPFATPATVILDGAWSMQWMKRGTFDAKSLSEGVTMLRKLGGTGTDDAPVRQVSAR